MACGSGCCGEPVSVSDSPEQSSSNLAPDTLMQGDRGSCCNDADLATDKNSDQLDIIGATPDELTEEEDCCAPKPATRPTPDSDCKKGCCSAPKLPLSDGTQKPVSSCCEGKAAPCCDQSCLDRLALRECEKFGSGDSGLAPHSNSRLSIAHTRSVTDVADMMIISQAQLPPLASEVKMASRARIMRTRPA